MMCCFVTLMGVVFFQRCIKNLLVGQCLVTYLSFRHCIFMMLHSMTSLFFRMFLRCSVGEMTE